MNHVLCFFCGNWCSELYNNLFYFRVQIEKCIFSLYKSKLPFIFRTCYNLFDSAYYFMPMFFFSKINEVGLHIPTMIRDTFFLPERAKGDDKLITHFVHRI